MKSKHIIEELEKKLLRDSYTTANPFDSRITDEGLKELEKSYYANEILRFIKHLKQK